MGDLLRRYWTPALLSAEIPGPGSPPARVRLLQENCPHRGASLYHGRCADMPSEPVPFCGAEKLLEPGEDWRGLGTGDDPVVREAFGEG